MMAEVVPDVSNKLGPSATAIMVGIGGLASGVAPYLADLSYIVAITVGVITIYYKIKDRKVILHP